MNRPLLWIRRVALTCVALILSVLMVPPSLYALGLNNVEGRPLPSPANMLTAEDQTLLERTFRVSHPIAVERLSPWGYATFILNDPQQTTAAKGLGAAWLVAEHYNAHHLRNRPAPGPTPWGAQRRTPRSQSARMSQQAPTIDDRQFRNDSTHPNTHRNSSISKNANSKALALITLCSTPAMRA